MDLTTSSTANKQQCQSKYPVATSLGKSHTLNKNNILIEAQIVMNLKTSYLANKNTKYDSR